MLNTRGDGQLVQTTVKQTPDFRLNTKPPIAAFVNNPANDSDILGGRHRLPVQFPVGTPFLDGGSRTPLDMFWDGPKDAIPNATARHLFSLATCSGCHAAETFPKGDVNNHFTHLFPMTRTAAGVEVQLSSFLTGKVKKPFPDLSDAADDFLLEDPAGRKDAAGAVIKRPVGGDLDRRAYFLRGINEYFLFHQANQAPLQHVH